MPAAIPPAGNGPECSGHEHRKRWLRYLALTLSLFGLIAEWSWLEQERQHIGESSWLRSRRVEAFQALGEPAAPKGCDWTRILHGNHIYRAAYFPSMMDISLAITVRLGSQETLSVAWSGPAMGSHGREVQTHHHVGALAPDAAARLEKTLSGIDAPALQSSNSMGMDGVVLAGDVCSGWRPNRSFSAWSPRNNGLQKYFQAIAEVALQTIDDSEATIVVERILSDVGNGVGVRDMGGQPRVFRIYGSFSIDEAGRIQQFLNGLPRNEPVILDMSNYGGAADAIEQEFVVFDKTRSQALWVIPTPVILARLGVSPGHIVPTIEAARARLR